MSIAAIGTIYYETEGIKISLIVFMIGILLVYTERVKPYKKIEMTSLLKLSTRIILVTLLI